MEKRGKNLDLYGITLDLEEFSEYSNPVKEATQRGFDSAEKVIEKFKSSHTLVWGPHDSLIVGKYLLIQMLFKKKWERKEKN